MYVLIIEILIYYLLKYIDEDMLGDSRDSEDGIENEGTDDDTNNGIICPRPYKRFRGHSKDVIDIAW